MTATPAGPGTAPSSAAWRDQAGCLTPSGLQAIAAAPAGQAPAELATHLAGCARCQERVLAADRPPGERRTGAKPPPPWRLALVFGAALLLILSILWTVHWLTTPQ